MRDGCGRNYSREEQEMVEKHCVMITDERMPLYISS
jgi:hypothetical protein